MVPFPFSFLSLLFFLMVPFDISRREFFGVRISFLLWRRCSKKIFSRWWKDAIFFHRAESYAAQKFLSVMNVQPKFFPRPWQGAAEIFFLVRGKVQPKFFSVYAILHRKSFPSWLRFSWWFCPRTRLVFSWKKIRQMLLSRNEYLLRSSSANGKKFSCASLNSFFCFRLRMKHISFQVLPPEPNLFFPSATHFSSIAQGGLKSAWIFPCHRGFLGKVYQVILWIFFALIFTPF